MSRIEEGALRIKFPKKWAVSQYDRWVFFDRFKSACGGNKGVDVIALDGSRRTLWLLELKDYRQHRREKDISIWDEFAMKVRDTLAGLFAAACSAPEDEQAFARECLQASVLTAVLHLERPAHPSRLFGALPEQADLQLKLRQLLKPIDAHPRVVSIESPMSGSPWSVESIG